MIELELIETYIDEIIAGELTIEELQEVANILNNNNPDIVGEIRLAYENDKDKYTQLVNELIAQYDTLVLYVNEDVFNALDWDMDVARINLGDDFLVELRVQMLEADITSEMSVIFFLATITHECDSGTAMTERGGDDYYDNEVKYDKNERGAGLMQVSVSAQMEYLDYLIDIEENSAKKEELEDYRERIKEKGRDELLDGLTLPEYIAEYHAIDSAIWRWGIYSQFPMHGGGTTINKFIDEHEACNREVVFLRPQYYVNGNQFNQETLEEMCHNSTPERSPITWKSYENEKDKLVCEVTYNGNTDLAPNGWENRIKCFRILEEYY